ncbi:hypothetical protein WA171_002103 [Blastocystis sp. BT1]
MEKEIADCLIRGDTPILPPESFVSEDKTNPLLEDEPIETKEEKRKRKKMKKQQFFRRIHLKKQRQIRNTVHQTPSAFQISSLDPEPFSRSNHEIHVQKYNEELKEHGLVTDGMTEEELEFLAEDQRKRITELEKENEQLSLMIYRMKKQLRHIASM